MVITEERAQFLAFQQSGTRDRCNFGFWNRQWDKGFQAQGPGGVVAVRTVGLVIAGGDMSAPTAAFSLGSGNVLPASA